MMTPRILIIAGSDSGGGAGVQADIKTVTMLGGHAMTAITAITAQNTLGVQAVMPVPTELVIAQIESVVSDIGVDAVKIGMLGSAGTAHAVADWLERLNHSSFPGEGRGPVMGRRMLDPGLRRGTGGEGSGKIPVVFDPVMVSTSGGALADADTIAAFERLMALATVVTPNLPEFEALERQFLSLGEREGAAQRRKGEDDEDDERGAHPHPSHAFGAGPFPLPHEEGNLLIKGGHGESDVLVDRLIETDGSETRWESGRIATTSTHGTGCTLASATATWLAYGLPLPEAIARARTFVRLALHEAPGLGRGNGPLGQQRVRQDVNFGLASPNQITLPMTDFDATRAFYDLLGLTRIVDAEPRYARYESRGGATLSIEAAHELDDKPLLFLECDDLDAAVARLRAAGHVVSDPVIEPWEWREARLADPFGNALCLYEAGEIRRFPSWRLGALP
jgi:hydroxymethylpyrimidine/phosphomethylpyrimidine kinase